MILREKILVLRIFKYSESDLVVHGLNPQGARMNFFAKGGLKSRKRFGGGMLEPTHYLEVAYKVRQSTSDLEGPLHTLLEATLIRDFHGLRSNYERLEAALYLVRLVHKLGQQGVVDSAEMFNLLGNALQACEGSENVENLKLQFELKLLKAHGVLPSEDAFLPWLSTSLALHAQLKIDGPSRQRLVSDTHAHLRDYLGSV